MLLETSKEMAEISPRVFVTTWFFTYTYLLHLSEIAALLLALLITLGAYVIKKTIARTKCVL